MDKITPLKVFIFGSCVSRDILNETDHQIELINYLARSSLASIGTAPFTQNVPVNHIKSDFQRRMVTYDLEKSLFKALRHRDFDILLLDLIDERLRIFQDMDSGAACTLSKEFMESGVDLHVLKGRATPPGTKMHWNLWEKGWKRLLNFLSDNQLLDRLRINQVYWSTKTDSGVEFPPPFHAEQITNANLLLDQMYKKIANDIAPDFFYNFPSDVFVAASDHRWGISPFHYVTDYYRKAIEKLNNEPRRG